MTSRDLILSLTALAGGVIGPLAPIGFFKWLLRTDPEEAGILTLLSFGCGACWWCSAC